jgi:hypothetical protein
VVVSREQAEGIARAERHGDRRIEAADAELDTTIEALEIICVGMGRGGGQSGGKGNGGGKGGKGFGHDKSPWSFMAYGGDEKLLK